MNKKEITKALAAAAEARRELDASTDALNKDIAEFEAAFASIAGGVRVEITISETPGDPIVERLIFSKWGEGPPRLLLAEIDVTREEDPHYGAEEIEPLANAPRSDRVNATLYFPSLLAALQQSIRAQLANLEEGRTLVKDCTEAIRAAQASSADDTPTKRT